MFIPPIYFYLKFYVLILSMCVITLCMGDKAGSNVGLIFLKTHKTGGSTVATMLHRFNCAHQFVPPENYDAHKWDFADGLDIALYSAQKLRQLGNSSSSHSYRMWTSHAIYHSFLHSVVPSPAVLVTVVRNPEARWLSAFLFYNIPKRNGYESTGVDSLWTLPGENSNSVYSALDIAEHVIDHSWKRFEETNFQNLSSIPMVPSQWSFNGMSEEMAGYVYGPLKSVSDAKAFALVVRQGQWYNRGLELVMVLERFEESVVSLGVLLGKSTNKGIYSDLLYARPINPTKQGSPLLLSSTAMKHLHQISVADNLLYSAANDRLSELLRCFDSYSIVKDCFSSVEKSSFLSPKDSLVSSMVRAHLSGVAEAKARCIQKYSQSEFCVDLALSDRDWSIRMNSQLPKPVHRDTTEQIIKSLRSEVKCTISRDGTEFPCVAGDYSDTAPTGSFEGPLVLLGNCCVLDETVPFATSGSFLIPVVPRGGCSFREKALVLQKTGYTCFILVDFDDQDQKNSLPITPYLGDALTIAAVMVSKSMGERLPITELRDECGVQDADNSLDSFLVKVEFLLPNQTIILDQI